MLARLCDCRKLLTRPACIAYGLRRKNIANQMDVP